MTFVARDHGCEFYFLGKTPCTRRTRQFPSIESIPFLSGRGTDMGAFYIAASLTLLAAFVTGGILRNEEPCLSHGGVCATNATCPDVYSEPNLCPEQEAEGGVCCSTIPTDVTECHQFGGECTLVMKCGLAPRAERATCPDGEVCCIYI